MELFAGNTYIDKSVFHEGIVTGGVIVMVCWQLKRMSFRAHEHRQKLGTWSFLQEIPTYIDKSVCHEVIVTVRCHCHGTLVIIKSRLKGQFFFRKYFYIDKSVFHEVYRTGDVICMVYLQLSNKRRESSISTGTSNAIPYKVTKSNLTLFLRGGGQSIHLFKN